MIKLEEATPRGEVGGAFNFVAGIGGMFNRGEGEQAIALAALLAGAAKANRPVLEAKEIARAARAWADVFDANPRLAARLLSRALRGADATMQARFDTPPAPQPQRIAAAPKPRAP